MTTNLTDSDHCAPWTFNDAPALVAHRGFAHLYPENTLIAIAAAVDAGARYVEFDIQLTKDQVPFLMHDDNLQRTAGLDASVFDLNSSQFKKIGVGEELRLGRRFHEVTPISLEDMCRHLNHWSHVHSFIEIKQQSIDAFGLETTMKKVLGAIESLKSPHTIISFSVDVLDYLKQHSESHENKEHIYTTGWVFEGWSAENFATLERLSPEFVYSNHKKIPDHAELPQGTWKWVLYEVTEPDVAQQWREKGIHMIETMAVTSMLKSYVFTGESNGADAS